MLHCSATDDKAILNRLHREIFGSEFDRGVGFVLRDGDKPIGLATLDATPEISTLRKIGIVPSERGKGYGDFFARSLLWGMANASERVAVATRDAYYLRFGLEESGEGMAADASRVTFPCAGCANAGPDEKSERGAGKKRD